MAVISLDCPNCGAALQPDDRERRARCQYCGTTFELARKTAYPPGQVTAPSAGRSLAPLIGSIAVALACVGAAVALSTRTTSFTPPAVPSTGAGAPSASAAALDKVQKLAEQTRTQADFMWDENGGSPQIVHLDGAEHVVGRLRKRGDQQLQIGVFAAETGAERYRVGPFGTYSEAYRATHFAVSGERLLVTDFRGKLRIFDLARGEPVQDIELTDRAKGFCQIEEAGEPPRLYLAQVDGRQFLVDAAAPALKEEKLPKTCDAQQRLHSRGEDPVLTNRERLRQAPKVEGIEVTAVHLDGEFAVARGVKAPGTAYPMAFGFDPKSREVRWKSPVAVVDQASVRQRDNEQDILADGRYFATYGEGSEHWHLAAFDAKTGARLWDSKLRSIFAVDWLHGIKATANHVFLVRMSSVEVYDAATGALKATIGSETYDG